MGRQLYFQRHQVFQQVIFAYFGAGLGFCECRATPYSTYSHVSAYHCDIGAICLSSQRADDYAGR